MNHFWNKKRRPWVTPLTAAVSNCTQTGAFFLHQFTNLRKKKFFLLKMDIVPWTKFDSLHPRACLPSKMKIGPGVWRRFIFKNRYFCYYIAFGKGLAFATDLNLVLLQFAYTNIFYIRYCVLLLLSSFEIETWCLYPWFLVNKMPIYMVSGK